jgi:uncharacterized protein YodC (DUF2158 family)
MTTKRPPYVLPRIVFTLRWWDNKKIKHRTFPSESAALSLLVSLKDSRHGSWTSGLRFPKTKFSDQSSPAGRRTSGRSLKRYRVRWFDGRGKRRARGFHTLALAQQFHQHLWEFEWSPVNFT